MRRAVWLIVCLLLTMNVTYGQSRRQKSQMRDSVTLETVTVTGKSKTQRLREGALAVNAVDVRSLVSSISSLSGLIDRTAGVKIREEGGVGSDFDLGLAKSCCIAYTVDEEMWMQGKGKEVSKWPRQAFWRI